MRRAWAADRKIWVEPGGKGQPDNAPACKATKRRSEPGGGASSACQHG